jgi:hypothetical protein
MQVVNSYNNRNNQFEANVLPHIDEYNLVLDSMANFSFAIVRDDFCIL